MELFYVSLFAVLVGATILLSLPNDQQWRKQRVNTSSEPTSATYEKFRLNYIVVYSLMMAGDWLQGPYIYVVYEHYGYKVGDIGRLFIAGFGSSMVFGTIMGALADEYGRKKASTVYVIVYSLSCMTKHFGQFWVLMLGRVLGGIACSLLFTAFESWLVAEHKRRNFNDSDLGRTFSKAVFWGVGVMAIVSGIVGNFLVEDMRMGPVAPFDAAIIVLVVGGYIMLRTWPENYGTEDRPSTLVQLNNALQVVLADEKIAILGAMQSLFEASMYTFIFLWTPALSPKGEKIPHGLVFACLMTACMAGSSLVNVLMQRFRVMSFMPWVYLVSSVSLFIPFWFHLEGREDVGSSLGDNGRGGLSHAGRVQLVSFCVFEACIGMFWPSMMTLRAYYVPEEMRTTILNLFRMPLNLFVCLILLRVNVYPLSVMFGLCAAFLLGAALLQLRLRSITHSCPLCGHKPDVEQQLTRAASH